jgi:hypothetical protein
VFAAISTITDYIPLFTHISPAAAEFHARAVSSIGSDSWLVANMFHAAPRCSAPGRTCVVCSLPNHQTNIEPLKLQRVVVSACFSCSWRCLVQSLVSVKGVRGNLGIDSLIRPLISGCEIPQLAGVHRARTIAPPTASLSICPRLVFSRSSSLPHRATSASSSTRALRILQDSPG